MWTAKENQWIETLSMKPRAFLYHNFLLDEECDAVIESARHHLVRASVAGKKGAEVHSIRTNDGAFISQKSHPTLEKISNKIADWMHVETTHQECMQVEKIAVHVQYSKGKCLGILLYALVHVKQVGVESMLIRIGPGHHLVVFIPDVDSKLPALGYAQNSLCLVGVQILNMIILCFLQVLRYTNGQKYGAHSDIIAGPSQVNNSRVATVLLYLTSTEEGGETTFPHESSWANPLRNPSRASPSDCARGNVYVKPQRGDALLFYSLQTDGSFDPSSVHGGCPVIEGEKWTAVFWIHEKPFTFVS